MERGREGARERDREIGNATLYWKRNKQTLGLCIMV